MEQLHTLSVLHLVNEKTGTSVISSWLPCFKKVQIPVKLSDIKSFFILQSKYDLIHGHHVKSSFIGAIFCFLINKPFIFTVHGSYNHLKKLNKILLLFVIIFSKHVCFVNNELFRQYPFLFKSLLKGKYDIIHNGIDLLFNYNKIDVKCKYSISNNLKIVFHPARFVLEKNQVLMINAFKKLLSYDPNFFLVLSGSGPLEYTLRCLVDKLSLQNNVLFTGLISKDEIYSFLSETYVYCMPSISEGLNVSFLEALMMNNRIVVSDINQFSEPLSNWSDVPSQLNVYKCNPSCLDSIFNALKNISHTSVNSFYPDFIDINNMIRKYRNTYYKYI